MAGPNAENPVPEGEPRLAVGWQKLTKQEFVEALTAALIEKVRSIQESDAEAAEAEQPESKPLRRGHTAG
jgi:hypothetical protein